MTDQHELFDALKYPDAPGYKDPDTSAQAAREMAESAGRLQRLCLEMLSLTNRTAAEVAQSLGMSVLAIRPRFSELLRKGLIEDTGMRRPNASGKSAKVWRAR